MSLKTSKFFPMLLMAAIIGQMKNPLEYKAPRGFAMHGYNPEFHSRRTKFKGWMRENRRCTFNKNN